MITPARFYKETAEELVLDEKLVERVNQFYWRYGILKEVTECNHASIYIKNIGSLYGGPKKVEWEIRSQIKAIRTMRRQLEKRGMPDRIERKLKVLRELLNIRNLLAVQKLNGTSQKWAHLQNG